MSWPKGKPRSAETKSKISNGLLYGAEKHNSCKICGKLCPTAGAIYCSWEHRSADSDYRNNVSIATTAAMQRPDVIDNHLSGIEERIAKFGSLMSGGKGHPPTELMLSYAKILCSVGYLMDEVTIPTGHGSYYLLDFAHPEAKINIEIDGNWHRVAWYRARDERRDEILRSLGWKIIRIRY